jgi:hypothetical protein
VYKITILEKENEILKRRLEGKRIVTNHLHRLYFVFLNRIMAVQRLHLHRPASHSPALIENDYPAVVDF